MGDGRAAGVQKVRRRRTVGRIESALMGIVGGLVITKWAVGLLRETSSVLLDGSVDQSTIENIRSKIETDGDNRVADLHVWKINTREMAAVASIVTSHPRPIDHYHGLLVDTNGLAHLTIEVNISKEDSCLPENRSEGVI